MFEFREFRGIPFPKYTKRTITFPYGFRGQDLGFGLLIEH